MAFRRAIQYTDGPAYPFELTPVPRTGTPTGLRNAGPAPCAQLSFLSFFA